MKSLLAVMALALGMASVAQAAPARVVPKCIRTLDIDRTTTPNDKTIIFHMRGGMALRNDLNGTCNGLRFNGFSYDATPQGELCANLEIIHVLRTHSVCALGPFTDVTPPPAAPHM